MSIILGQTANLHRMVTVNFYIDHNDSNYIKQHAKTCLEDNKAFRCNQTNLKYEDSNAFDFSHAV